MSQETPRGMEGAVCRWWWDDENQDYLTSCRESGNAKRRVCGHCKRPVQEVRHFVNLESERERPAPAPAAPGLEWTREKPTAPGWYWLLAWNAHPEVNKICQTDLGLEAMDTEGDKLLVGEHGDHCRWAGPIQEPVEAPAAAPEALDPRACVHEFEFSSDIDEHAMKCDKCGEPLEIVSSNELRDLRASKAKKGGAR